MQGVPGCPCMEARRVRQPGQALTPVALLLAQANEDCVIAGRYLIPKGAWVHFNIWCALPQRPHSCWKLASAGACAPGCGAAPGQRQAGD